MNSVRFFSFPILSVFVLALAQLGSGQGMAPSPSPAGPSNDGTAIDQGIAFGLLLVALVITYLVH